MRDVRVHNCARWDVLHSPDAVINFFWEKPGIEISEVTTKPWPWSSSSGSPLDYGARGPKFDSRWKLGSFPLSSLLSLNHWCALQQIAHGGATQLIFNFPTNK